MTSRVGSIKRSQKESLYYRIISSLLLGLIRENVELSPLFVSHVELSANKGACFVFFGAPDEKFFNKHLKTLTLYKPSIRKALGSEIQTRYVPELFFKYDKKLEKQREVEELLNKLKIDGEV